MRDAFNAIERQLKAHADKASGRVKSHGDREAGAGI
jgi:hypothetical protein